jgi:hypothetical protein
VAAHGIRFAYRNLDHDDGCSAKHEGIAASDAGDVSHTYKRNRRDVSEGRWNSSVLKRSKRDSIRISMGSTYLNDKSRQMLGLPYRLIISSPPEDERLVGCRRHDRDHFGDPGLGLVRFAPVTFAGYI